TIGLTPAQVTQLAGELAEARADYETATRARNASMSATVGFHASADTLVGDGRDLIATIKAFAEASGDPQVYVRASVPPPAPPSVVGPPGTPTRFCVSLQGNGSFNLTWHADNPQGSSGTIYEVLRSDDGGPFAFLGTTGTRRFADTTLPAGTGTAVYQITGVRSTSRGEPARFIVQLGTKGTHTYNNADNNADEDGMNIAA
ncbi:hypothetical protein MNBD_PLANCTO03-615, partial [hydrothermal vent metagenome]